MAACTCLVICLNAAVLCIYMIFCLLTLKRNLYILKNLYITKMIIKNLILDAAVPVYSESDFISEVLQ